MRRADNPRNYAVHPLSYALRQSAKALGIRYRSRHRDPVRDKAFEEITKAWECFQGDDFKHHLRVPLGQSLNYYSDWKKVQWLKTPGWMEKVFDKVLNDPKSVWDS